MKMNVEVNGTVFTAVLENNGAADALVEMMKDQPVTIQMRDYAGFEKVGPLGQNLPASDSRTTTQAGDIVLYQGNQIVIFYGSNTWSSTRTGKNRGPVRLGGSSGKGRCGGDFLFRPPLIFPHP